jgi:hypothetical protein
LFVDEFKLGRILISDSGINTKRDPDTVRGADIAFYSYARMPKGPAPNDYGGGEGLPNWSSRSDRRAIPGATSRSRSANI